MIRSFLLLFFLPFCIASAAPTKCFRELWQLSPDERIGLSRDEYIEIMRGPRMPLPSHPPRNLSEWMKFFKTSVSRDFNRESQPLFVEFRDDVARMPQHIRVLLLEEIAKLLPSALKGSEEDERSLIPSLRSFPRRTFDSWIKVLLPPQKLFEKSYAKTGDALTSFQSYLDLVNKFVISKNESKGFGKGLRRCSGSTSISNC